MRSPPFTRSLVLAVAVVSLVTGIVATKTPTFAQDESASYWPCPSTVPITVYYAGRWFSGVGTRDWFFGHKYDFVASDPWGYTIVGSFEVSYWDCIEGGLYDYREFNVQSYQRPDGSDAGSPESPKYPGDEPL